MRVCMFTMQGCAITKRAQIHVALLAHNNVRIQLIFSTGESFFVSQLETKRFVTMIGSRGCYLHSMVCIIGCIPLTVYTVDSVPAIRAWLLKSRTPE